MSKIVLFQTIPFSISTLFSSIWPIERTLSGTTTLDLRRSRSNGNEEVLYIPQSSSITLTSPSDCLVSYPGHSWGESYPSAEKQSVYSIAPAEWAIGWLILCHINHCRLFNAKFCLYIYVLYMQSAYSKALTNRVTVWFQINNNSS